LQVYTAVWFRAAVFWGTALRVGQLTHPAATLLDDDSRNTALKPTLAEGRQPAYVSIL